MSNQVPDVVISRLPIYLRALNRLEAEGRQIVSSRELATILGANNAQIRKDLVHFGEFGKQGTGYHITHLIKQLRRILLADQVWEVALVGAGALGRALLCDTDIARRGFRIVAAFDNNPKKIGSRVGDVLVQNSQQMKDEIVRREIQLAIVAVPPPAAQQVADVLVEAGIKAILNYSPITLNAPDGVLIKYIDPVAHLQHMTYYLSPR